MSSFSANFQSRLEAVPHFALYSLPFFMYQYLWIYYACHGDVRPHAEGVMRPDRFILFEPLTDDGLGLASGAKRSRVENLSAKCSAETHVVAFFPG